MFIFNVYVIDSYVLIFIFYSLCHLSISRETSLKYLLVFHRYTYLHIGTFISIDWTCHDSFDKFVRVSLSLSLVYIYTYCRYSISVHSYGEKMSQSCWLLYTYMNRCLAGGNRNKMMYTHTHTHTYNQCSNWIRDDMCDNRCLSYSNIIGIVCPWEIDQSILEKLVWDLWKWRETFLIISLFCLIIISSH